MEHGEALGLFEAYFKNELPREKVRELHAHFNACEDCKLRLRTMHATGLRPGFTLGRPAGSEQDRMQEILRRNRIITYAIIIIMACFFFFFRMKRGG
jgi:hypothetical protein